VDLDFLIVEILRSHSDAIHSVDILWTSDWSATETSTWQHTPLTKTSTLPAGFELAIPASEWQRIHVLAQAATGIGQLLLHHT